MKNRILSMLAVLAIAVNMVGCAPSDSSAPVEATEQVVEETELSETKQALTFDEVNRIEINGVEVSLPFKIEDLGEGYSIGEEQGNVKNYPAIYFDNQCLAFIDYDNDNNITSVSFPSDSLKNNDIELCNLSFYDNYDKIISVLGMPSIQGTLFLIYEYEKGEVNFSLDDDNATINVIKISLNGGIENNQ